MGLRHLTARWGSIKGTLADQTDLQNALDDKVPYTGATANVDLGDFSLKASELKLNTSYAITGSEDIGSIYWNSERETAQLRLNSSTALNVFEHQIFYVKNQTGSTLEKGKPVMFAGAVGASGRFLAEYALADGSTPAIYTMGLMSNDLLNGDDGVVIGFGEIRGISTDGSDYGESWSDGTILYVSPTVAGDLTSVQPSAPNYAIPVAAVINAHATNGTLFVRPTFPLKLAELSDVDGTPLTTTGQFPVWDNTNGYFDFNYNINDYLQSGDNISELVNDSGYITGNETITLSGDVTGSGTTSIVCDVPDLITRAGSSTDNSVTRWNGTGLSIQSSTTNLNDSGFLRTGSTGIPTGNFHATTPSSGRKYFVSDISGGISSGFEIQSEFTTRANTTLDDPNTFIVIPTLSGAIIEYDVVTLSTGVPTAIATTKGIATVNSSSKGVHTLSNDNNIHTYNGLIGGYSAQFAIAAKGNYCMVSITTGTSVNLSHAIRYKVLQMK